MNVSRSRRRWLGVAAAVSAGTVIHGRFALGATMPHAAAKPRLAVCIDALFTDLPFEQRLARVKAAGVDAFEFWGWRGRDMDRLARMREELGMEVAGFACDTGGPLVAPGSAQRIMAPLRDTLATARKLGCRQIIAQVGNELQDIPRAQQHENCVEAFRAAAPLCEDAGVTLSIETLNVLVDHKGYYLATSEEGFRMVDAVGSPHVRLLFDVYHQQITEGNLIANITANIGKIAHFHVADVPGRHQPGTGEINYVNVFRAIAATGFAGFLGLEMWPTVDHTQAIRESISLLAAATAPQR
ncbi:MAG: TIM barrel protein [Pirellulaceae bacterium]|jgi:hydroxypyruvate isomerase|nr:TIM barrel protein [Pirellulaceae bacterium]